MHGFYTVCFCVFDLHRFTWDGASDFHWAMERFIMRHIGLWAWYLLDRKFSLTKTWWFFCLSLCHVRKSFCGATGHWPGTVANVTNVCPALIITACGWIPAWGRETTTAGWCFCWSFVVGAIVEKSVFWGMLTAGGIGSLCLLICCLLILLNLVWFLGSINDISWQYRMHVWTWSLAANAREREREWCMMYFKSSIKKQYMYINIWTAQGGGGSFQP